MYKVLWVDDEYDTPELQEVADVAFNKGIDMNTACKSAEEALAHLEHPDDFDAIILDARFFKSENAVSGQENLKGLKKVTGKLNDLYRQGNRPPTCIYSGQTDLTFNEDFKDTYEDYPIYDKHSDEDREKMFAYIIKEVNEREVTQVKQQYSEMFEVCNSKYYFDSSLSEKLLDYAIDIKQGNTKNSDRCNSMRKIMEDFFDICTKLGIIRSDVRGINAQSRFICDSKMSDYIPEYVQNSIRFIVQSTQSGSHNGVTDSDMKNGFAPYLLRSLFFALGNVLVWWKRFIDGKLDFQSIIEVAEKIQVEYKENTQPSNVKYPLYANKIKGV